MIVQTDSATYELVTPPSLKAGTYQPVRFVYRPKGALPQDARLWLFYGVRRVINAFRTLTARLITRWLNRPHALVVRAWFWVDVSRHPGCRLLASPLNAQRESHN